MGLSPDGAVETNGSLRELPREMSACPDLAALRAFLAERLPALLPVCDRVSIVFAEPDGEWLRIHRILPVPPDSDGPLPRVRIEGTPVGEVVRDRVARVVEDVRRDPNITFGHASHDGIRSTLSVPIWLDGRVIGALNAGSRTIGACHVGMLRRMHDVAAIVGPLFHATEQATPRSSTTPRTTTGELLGGSAATRALLDAARRTASSDVDVLITGETGVGKTALARAIHAWSPRAHGPFVTVHVGDLAPTLVESELFGYERGAFTGALANRIGRFETARGGTIFLDEIGEAPLAIQTKLLRVVQDRRFERVGGSTTLDADIRIITATSRDLASAMRRNEFREDLYYRLSVVPLHVRPLRERKDDLEQLVPAILSRVAPTRRLSTRAWARIQTYDWPGNVRELESILRRAAILEQTDELELPELALPELAPPAGVAAPAPVAAHWPTLEQHERDYIEQILIAHNGMIEGEHGVARILGVPPSTLRSRMKRLGISPGKGRTR